MLSTKRTLSRLLVAAGLAALLAACGGSDDDAPPATASNVLYVQSNEPIPGRNSVIAYARAADGSLSLLPGSPFLSGGLGSSNPTAAELGPNDLDFPLIASADRQRLFAVNSGSNTIAVFDIAANGSLTPIAGSPFPSGGRQPVSLTIAGNRLYVVNKNEDSDQLPNNDLPNSTGFDIGADGKLTPIANSTVSTIAGASPAQVLASRDGNLLFGADFWAPVVQPGIGSLRSFQVNADGSLTQPPSSPLALPPGPVPPPPLPLGLMLHPSQNILYVGFVTRYELGVYNYDAQTGVLAFVTAVPNSGLEICWIRTNAAGTRIYTVNNIDNSVSFYDNSNPLLPVERQHLVMKEPGPLFLNTRGFLQPTSTPFEPALSPDERFLYVVNNRVNQSDPTVTVGNKLHILTIAADGTLSEPHPTVSLPVPPTAHPQGLVVF